MGADIFYTLLFSVAFISLFGFSELLFHSFKLKVEITRKLVHISSGILTLLFPLYLTNIYCVLALCASFGIILSISERYSLLRSITGIDRRSYGSICYPISVFICFLLYQQLGKGYIIFYSPILTLAICDPLAAFVGRSWPKFPYKVGNEHKTISGSSAFFCGSLAVNSVLFSMFMPQAAFPQLLLYIITISISSTIAEAISRKGFDNLFIPLTAMAALLFCSI